MVSLYCSGRGGRYVGSMHCAGIVRVCLLHGVVAMVYVEMKTSRGVWEPTPEGEFETVEEAILAMEDLERREGWRDLRVNAPSMPIVINGLGWDELPPCNTLSELHQAYTALVRAWHDKDDPSLPVPDTSSLPTFGGDPPEDTIGVWSWDETHLLVGLVPGRDGSIVARSDYPQMRHINLGGSVTFEFPYGAEQFDAAAFTQEGKFIKAGHREECECAAREAGGLYCVWVDGRPLIWRDFEELTCGSDKPEGDEDA